MAVDDENPDAPVASKPSPIAVLQRSSTVAHPPPPPLHHHPPIPDDTSPKKPMSPKEFILSVASNISSQPLTNPDPDVWGVLTAISNNARKRHQGINMILTGNEHCIGRLVDDVRFQIESTAVSGNHCKICRKNSSTEDTENRMNGFASVFLKDTSTNGTYLNWKKLNKSSPEVKIHHGDIISFAASPQHEIAFAFVYREVPRSTPLTEVAVAKRKADEILLENKRLKGIGIGAPEGPISLDDFRSLQRSNTELRKQLESQVLAIDILHNDHKATIERHETEIKEIKEAAAKLYVDQLKELQHMLDTKQKELVEVNRVSAEQKHTLEDLNERLSASRQSCIEANEIMKSQKASMAELEVQLEEERDQRREERHKATADLKAAVQRVQAEAQVEFKRQSDATLQRERELQEEINKLQEREKKWCSQVDTLRPKLEETRQKLVISDNKVRQLEAQIRDEQLVSANGRKKVEDLEQEIRRLRKDLEGEKAAREEAWAKVSALEMEMNAAMRDLEYERRRLKGARERIMLRETQLRAFYSTTEEISVLFAKQQEQLKAMQKTLEDEENYENTSVDIDLIVNRDVNGILPQKNGITGYHNNKCAKAESLNSAQRYQKNQATSGDEASVTEKHDCDIRSQGEDQNTQGEEFTSIVKGGFGSDIDGLDRAPALAGDAMGTEQVLETESLGIDGERNVDLNRCDDSLVGDTMQLEDETHAQDSHEQIRRDASCQSQSNSPVENQNDMEDAEPGCTIRTADLLASEVAGSWAHSTAPSFHGENESPRNRDNDELGDAGVHNSGVLVAESQSTPSSEVAVTRRNREYQALTEMIGIVAPDMKEEFGGLVGDNCEQKQKEFSASNSDTEACSDSDDPNKKYAKSVCVSDADTQGIDQPDGDAMDEDDEATQEDSLG
uniref:FHA domain-containing protein n=2 Tax=Rhizophora mucronata TaxID=61149 RepID=A0A2P2J5X1_RHIMU